MGREVEVDSPAHCMTAMGAWWHTGTRGDDFHEACERLRSPKAKVRAKAAADALGFWQARASAGPASSGWWRTAWTTATFHGTNLGRQR